MRRWKHNEGILNFPKYCMIAMGMWRLNLPTQNKILTKFYIIYSCLIQIYYPVFWTSLFVKFVIVMIDKNSNKSMEEWFKDLSYVVGFLIIMMSSQFWQKKDSVRNILYVIEEENVLLRSRDEELLKCHLELVQFSRLMNYVFLCIAVGAGVSVMSETFRRRNEVEKYNKKYNGTLEKPYAFDLFFLFDFDKEQYSSLLLIVDGISCLLTDIMGISSKIMFISCIIFACSSLQRLQIKCRKMTLYETDLFDALSHLIRENQQIISLRKLHVLQGDIFRKSALNTAFSNTIRTKFLLPTLVTAAFALNVWFKFVQNLNHSIKYLILVEYLLTSLNIAAVSIQVMLFNSTRASALFFLSYLFSQILILGWSANEIKMQSLGIADAIYDSPWYDQSDAVKKTVLFIIMRAQRPLQLTIGPFNGMTTETAVTILKASYSYITLMRTEYV